MSFAIPVQRLHETETLLAYYHPQPAYAFDVLIMPKKAVAPLADLDATDSAILIDLFSAIQSLVDEFHLPA